MTLNQHFSVDTAVQQGRINICRFGSGLELKHAELYTRCETESGGRFDPDLRMIFTLEGRTHLQFGSRHIYLQAGSGQSAALLPVNEPAEGCKIFHQGRQNELVLFCSSHLLAETGCPAEVLKILRSSHLQAACFCPDAAIETQLQSLLALAAEPEAWQPLRRHARTVLLVAEVLRMLFPVKPPQHAAAHKRLNRLLPLLHNPEHFNSSIATLAKLCNSNPTSLQHDFQTAFATSIDRYRREYRLNQARIALKQQQSVNRAAQLAGYGNPECFSKAFKKQFGKSPSRYRLQD